MERCGCGVARHSSHISVARLTGWLTTSPTPEVWKRNLAVSSWGGEQRCGVVQCGVVWSVVLSSQNWFPVCPGGCPGPAGTPGLVWRLVELGLSPRHLRVSLSQSRERAESRYRLFNCYPEPQGCSYRQGDPEQWAVTSDQHCVRPDMNLSLVKLNWYPDSWR